MNRERVAFIHYPHHPDAARLDTMPFALNTVIRLAETDRAIDLYLWEQPSEKYQTLLPDNVRFFYFKEPVIGPLKFFRPFWQQLRFTWSIGYSLVLGVGQIGVHIGRTIAKSNRCPLVYINDEFPSCWWNSPHRFWGRYERNAVQHASLIIVPDEQRFKPLCQELNVEHISHVELPNIPKMMTSVSQIDWYSRLRISHEQFVFLHAGSVADWAQIPELICTVPDWPESAVLLIHSRSQEDGENYRKKLSHLELPERVIWSYEPLPEEELHSLISFATASFALYRNIGPNVEYMGKSSGKLMRSIACSTPVIASRFESISFVENHQLGALLSCIWDIPGVVQELMINRQRYSENCRKFLLENISFEQSWHALCKKLYDSCGITL